MARIWKEERQGHWSEHFDMHGYQGLPGHDVSPDPRLIPVYTYFVDVCGFTFRFGSVAQIDVALDYYRKQIHPSSRLPDSQWLRSEHDVAQRWYERVPGYLREEPKREKVEMALAQALEAFKELRGKFPIEESKASNLPRIEPGN